MFIAIRIKGQVEISKIVSETLFRLGMRRKYSAVLLEENASTEKILNKIRNFVAYGRIDEKMLQKLIEKRGQPIKRGEKIDAKKVASELGKKNLKELGLKPFFRLHPPLKGIDSKKHFGVDKGVLGDNKEKINSLLERML